MEKTRLSKRLQTILRMVRNSHLILDLGADHGLLSKALLEEKKGERIIASEKGNGPFKTLAFNLRSFPEIEVRQGDGLSVITSEDKADEVIIAGMGGKTILDILEKGKPLLPSFSFLVLEPQSDFHDFFPGLKDLGLVLIDEEYVVERKKYYPVCLYIYGKEKELNEAEAEFGRIALAKKDPLLKEKILKEKSALSALPESGLKKNLKRIDLLQKTLETYFF